MLERLLIQTEDGIYLLPELFYVPLDKVKDKAKLFLAFGKLIECNTLILFKKLSTACKPSTILSVDGLDSVVVLQKYRLFIGKK